MKVYTLHEINRFGIKYQALKDSFTLKILNRVFVRSADFPKRFQEQAIAAYKKNKQSQTNSFLVETTPFLLTLWTEKILTEPSNSPQEKQEKKNQSSLLATSEPSDLVRYYRGTRYQPSLTLKPQDLTRAELTKLAEEKPELKGYIQKKLNFPDFPVKTYRGVAY
ncbi:MAG: hypothetical protein AB4041_09265 [Microcystaceae cyanobacterium]